MLEKGMGLLTLKDFRDELNLSLGDNRQPGNERLDRWVNLGYLQAVNEEWFEGIKEVATAVTVANQREYDLPTDLMSIVSVADLTNKFKLVKTSWSNMQNMDRDVTGVPRLYARRRRTLYLWPVPDGVFSLEVNYLEEICPLIEPGDRTVLPQAYDPWIIQLSRVSAFSSLGLEEKAAFYTRLADKEMNKLPTDTFGSDENALGVDVATSFDDLGDMRTSTP
jgi:hypothetical protein